jgi:hypothetical protein
VHDSPDHNETLTVSCERPTIGARADAFSLGVEP